MEEVAKINPLNGEIAEGVGKELPEKAVVNTPSREGKEPSYAKGGTDQKKPIKHAACKA